MKRGRPAKYGKPSKASQTPRNDNVRSRSQVELSGIYSDDQLEFLRAVERFKTAKRIQFPACTDYLGILLDLGYRKVADHA